MQHFGRDSSQALMMGAVGLAHEECALAGGGRAGSPAGGSALACHYEHPTLDTLLDMTHGAVRRATDGALCCAGKC